MGEVHLQFCMCARAQCAAHSFSISRVPIAGRIVLKFGGTLGPIAMQYALYSSYWLRTCILHLRISGTDRPIVPTKILCMARDPIVTRFAKVGGEMTAQCTFACASPVLLSRKPLNPVPETTPKADLHLSRSLARRQTWRLTVTQIFNVYQYLKLASRFALARNRAVYHVHCTYIAGWSCF